MVNLENSYWNENGKHQDKIELLNDMVPASGSVDRPRKNRALEKFRKASNCYYDLYNNGLCNRAQEFRQVFGISSSQYVTHGRGLAKGFDRILFDKVEEKMDEIVAAAASEQGLSND